MALSPFADQQTSGKIVVTATPIERKVLQGASCNGLVFVHPTVASPGHSRDLSHRDPIAADNRH
jgi:hypothetical protein